MPTKLQASKPILITIAILGLIAFFLGALEWRARRAGEAPGQLYPSFHVTDTLISRQILRSDETGMNYLDTGYRYGDTTLHINKQGFISDFDYTPAIVDSFHILGKKVVFLIGDSYVSGVSTTIFDKTFAQQLQHNTGNYVIFNFGVPGADPLQYQLVARKYLNLKPDLLVVAFCGANDVMHFDHAATPGIPYYYQTNAGWLSSVVPSAENGGPNRVFSTPAEAYQYYAATTTLFRRSSLFARFCKHFCITTQLYFWLYPGLPEGNYKPGFDCGASYKYLRAVDSLCKNQHIPFEIVFTPDPDKALLKDLKTAGDCEKKYQTVFRNLMPHTNFITGFDFKDDFKATDKRHFSDEGNRKFAAFVNKIITAKL